MVDEGEKAEGGGSEVIPTLVEGGGGGHPSCWSQHSDVGGEVRSGSKTWTKGTKCGNPSLSTREVEVEAAVLSRFLGHLGVKLVRRGGLATFSLD